MSVPSRIAKLYKRVDAFLEHGDAAAVMSEAALAEAARLEELERGRGDGRGGGLDPAVPAAVGWLYWCRYGAGGRLPELASALERFLPVRARHPEALPDFLNAILDLIDGAPGAGRAVDADETLHAVLFELSGCFFDRFHDTGAQSDVDRAVAGMRLVAGRSHANPAPPLLLGSYLISRATRTDGDAGDDLREAQRSLDLALGLTPRGHPLRPQYWYMLVLLRAAQLQEDDGIAQVDALIDALTASLAELPADEPVRDQVAELAAATLGELSERIGRRDTARAVRLWRLGVAAIPPADPRHGQALFQLGSAIALRAGESANPAVGTEAIEVLREAASVTHGPLKALSTTGLGNAYLQMYERQAQPGDVLAAITAFRAALLAIPSHHELTAICRTNLAGGLLAADEAGIRDTIDETIELLRTVTGADDPAIRARACFLLGQALRKRSTRRNDLADLGEAVEWHRAAVAAESPDAYGYPDSANNLAATLWERYRRLGAMSDLDEAIEWHRAAVAGDDTDVPRRLRLLANLAAALNDRFDATGDPEAAAEALRVARAAAAVPLPSGMAVDQLPALSGMLYTAFEVSGSAADLEESIRLRRAVAGLLPDGDARRPWLLSGLGSALLARYELAGAVADLDEAVSLYRRAIAANREANLLASLCHALELQFRVTGDLSLLDEAVQVGREAAETGVSGPVRVSYLTNLGNAYSTRHRAAGDAADLDAAIEAQRGAVEAAGAGNRRRARYLSALGAALMMRYHERTNANDLDEAIVLLGQCIEATPMGDLRRAAHLLNNGLARYMRYRRDRSPEDLAAGLRALGEAARSTTSPAFARLMAAQSHAELAREGGDTAAAADGYAHAVTLLPVLAWHGLDRADQERQLLGFAGLASDAAATALAHGDPTHAGEFLEHGRSVLWAQLLDRDTDLSALRRADPALADRLTAARAELDSGQVDVAGVP